MEMKIEQKMKQTFSHKMIQFMGILQMNTQELTEYIKELSNENIMMELEDVSADDRMAERQKKLDWLKSLDEQNRTYYQYDAADTEEDYLSNLSVRHMETLRDALMMQIIGLNFSEEDRQICEYIAESLDRNGFFTGSPERIGRKLHLPVEQVSRCLELMKSLDPPGVCAANLQECLLIQLKKLQENTKSTDRDENLLLTEIAIVEEHMELLGKNQLHVIARKLDVPLERVKEAAENIRQLNPRPSQGYDNNELYHYATPDVVVIKFPGRFEILLNSYSYPEIRWNQHYLEMYARTPDAEVKDYLEKKIDQIKQVQSAMENRGSTLLRLVQCIVEVQKDFFVSGKPTMHPFMMKDAAQKLGVHESTISRAVKGKFLQCCWGTYPFEYFFSRGVHTGEEDAEISMTDIKERIRELIEKENPAKPYSDQKLAELLKEEGVDISRRTVMKYRESMGIANSRGRKQF